jgi:hypothetical protein
MARTALTKTALPAFGSDGLDLTNASFTTLSTGSGNGKTWDFDATDIIILKNDTGGSATFTFILNPLSSVTALGATVTDPVVVVANGVTRILQVNSLFQQGSDSKVYVDCDVAGKVLVLDI